MLCEYFLDNNNNFIFKLKIFCSKIYLSSTCFILYSIDLLYNSKFLEFRYFLDGNIILKRVLYAM